MKFRFEAFDGAGQLVVGDIEAPSEDEARRLVGRRGVTPFAIRTGRRTDFLFRQIRLDDLRGALGDKVVARLARDLGVLLQAHLPLDAALRILVTTCDDRPARDTIQRLLQGILDGATLAEAMQALGPAFRAEYIRIVQAGDAGADVATAMLDLADLLDRRVQGLAALRAATAYPALLVALAFVSLGIVLHLLVPAVTPIFLENGKALPTILWALNAMRGYSAPAAMTGAAVLGAGAVALVLARRREASRLVIDRMIRRIPLYGRISETRQAARVVRTLATLIKAGVAPLHALQTASTLAGNADMRDRLHRAVADIRAGVTIGDAVTRTGALPEVARRMITVGEESGRLQEMLLRAALILERQEQTLMSRTLAVLTPAVTLLVSGLIASVILSVMGAILSINDLAIQ
jgi:general secretion pathway protein F